MEISMASTLSVSDLLESFASLVFTILVDTVGDMPLDLLCASASIEPLRRDLELMNDVQHCLNLVALRCALRHFCGVRRQPANPFPS